MLYVKRFGIILEEPLMSYDTMSNIIDITMKHNLIPIIALQDGLSSNNHLNIANKIEILRNKFIDLREDNFYIMKEEDSFKKDRFRFRNALKHLLNNINTNAFGIVNQFETDKVFITNINNYIFINNKHMLLSKMVDSIVTDLVSAGDVMNFKSYLDEKEIVYDPYFNSLFSNRSKDEIYFDESKPRTFIADIRTHHNERLNVYMIDPVYMAIIEKYNLGAKLFPYRDVVYKDDPLATPIKNYIGMDLRPLQAYNTPYDANVIVIDAVDRSNVIRLLDDNDVKYHLSDSNELRIF